MEAASTDGTDGLTRLAALGFNQVTTPPLSLGAARLGPDAIEVTGTRPALGTLVSVTVIVPSVPQGEDAIAEAFAELDRLNDIFSRYQTDTALSVLNEHGQLAGPPPELALVLGRALEFFRASRGAFDVTVKPILDLYASCLPEREPQEGEVREAAALVGAGHVKLDRGGIRLERAGMGITLDGIAKGHIVDRMAAVLEERGLGRYLIDAGGDLRVRGLNGRGGSWVVGVRDPDDSDRVLDVIALGGGTGTGSVATSGSYARFFDRPGRFHHIVTPTSGFSPHAVTSVSVIAPDGLTADALATAVFVLGAEAGLSFIETLSHCGALVLDSGGTTHRSRRWTAHLTHNREGSLP
jgi:thiamine biosynthesis lipoprotein